MMSDVKPPRFSFAVWPGDALSPIVLMIDDFADVYVEIPGYLEREKDWGHLCGAPGSAWEFYDEKIRKLWPDLKTCIFIPVDRKPLVESVPKGSFYASISQRQEMGDFLRELDKDPLIEFAYHGKEHFLLDNEDRCQEWLGYSDTASAVAGIRSGLKIFEDVFTQLPFGGKYPGYTARERGLESILETGFGWWCSRFSRNRISDLDTPLENLQPRLIEGSDCVEMPSTLAGNVLTPYLNSEVIKWPKRYLQRRKGFQIYQKQIDCLLKNRCPITIQEHIAPSRSDLKRQSTNIQDDRTSLEQIKRLVQSKNLWHAHLSEIADWYRIRMRAELLESQDKRLQINLPSIHMLSEIELRVHDDRVVELINPEGYRYPVESEGDRRVCFLPASSSIYTAVVSPKK